MNFFSQPLNIGRLRVANRVFLAPLAGVSDVPFRRICQQLGAGLTYVEMLSSVAISYKNKRTFEMMARHNAESVLGVQVTGPSAELVAQAIEVLSAKGFDTVDINMGCPVRKVVGAGCGSAILKEPERISQTLKMARAATSLPLSAKVRLGYTRENVNIEDTTERIVQNEADMFTIHGRTRSENYSTPVDFEGIARGIAKGSAKSAEIPPTELRAQRAVSVGNGDIFDWQSATAMQEKTGCDAVMVSRGALGNPWIFAEILSGKTITPNFADWYDVVMRHVDYHEEHYGNTRTSAVLLRKHLLWYSKGFPGSKILREQFNNMESMDIARSLLADYAARVSKGFVRYSGSAGDAAERVISASEPGADSKYGPQYDPKYEMDRTLDRGVGDLTGADD